LDCPSFSLNAAGSPNSDSFKDSFMLKLPCQMMVRIHAMSARVVLREIMENYTQKPDWTTLLH